MESAVDAQSLISMSLMKIHNSRTQRGGIKLHKNLLVSYVLRNARQVYIKEKYAEIYRLQQYEEVLTVCNEIQELDPLHEEPAKEPPQPEPPQPQPGPEPGEYRSCCLEPPAPLPSPAVCEHFAADCSQTTVLDLDTHVVTTVENGFLHHDCCCRCRCGQGARPPARKRKGEFGCCASEEAAEEADCSAARKRAKRGPGPGPGQDPCPGPGPGPGPGPDYTDTANISNLISIFGSGFSGLLSRQADLEQVCSKQALASLGAWTRAIVAF